MRLALVLLALAPALTAADLFIEAAAVTGLAFRHFTGATGEYLMPEIMGSGVALFDYDNDGDLDVYLVQGASSHGGDRLFRNMLAEEGRLRFEDVTEQARLAAAPGHGMGVATGDIDNDGYIDLFVSRFGPDQLLRNNGDGTFSPLAGPWDDGFGASASFLDYDGDGLLDLFLTRYNGFTVEGNKQCRDQAGRRDYCSPLEYPPLPDRLYRNLGDGRFQDVTAAAGVDQAFGAGLGVAAADFNGDGRIDIYVANDKTANQLWINQGDGAFTDEALLAGAAFNADGMAEAGMGVAVGDYDGDGNPDIFVTHIAGETNTLYRNEGDGLFEDVTAVAGLAHTSVAATGFGVQWFDFDNDGDLDLFAVNGEVRRGSRAEGDFPYDQPNQLFRNNAGEFEEISSLAGGALQQSGVSRGAAFGDIDNDGDIDVVINDAGGPVRLLLNQAAGRRGWLLVRLLDGKRDAFGARAALQRPDRKPLWRQVGTDGSYLSAGDPRLHFGLGDEPRVEELRVIWADGSEERFAVTDVNKAVTLRRFEGER
jgi:enediyne biosynthesis protein E4